MFAIGEHSVTGWNNQARLIGASVYMTDRNTTHLWALAIQSKNLPVWRSHTIISLELSKK
jgi:hypothetical protein